MPKSNYTFLWTDYQPARTMEWNTLGISKYPEIISNKIRKICYVSRENMLSCYYSNDDLAFQAEEGKGFLDKREYEKFIKGVAKNYKDQWQFNKKLLKINYSKLSNDELYGLFGEVNDSTAHSICYFRATQHEPTIALLDKIRSKFSNDEFSLLISPTVPDITNEEQMDWEQIVKKRYSKDIIIEHVGKYPWLVISHFTAEDVIETLTQRYDYDKVHFEHKDIIKEKKELKKEQDKTLKKHPEIKEYVLRAQRLALTRMEVKSAWASQDFYIMPLMYEISKRTGEDIKDIGKYYLIEEVKDLLDGKKLSNEEKERRKKCFVGLWRDGKLTFASGEEGEEIAKKELVDLYEVNKSDELKGNVANPGIARGIARIHEVNNVEQTRELRRNFKKGDILISGMTQPNIMDVASKAAAFVTDEGGMLSHAAIVSRELKIPCIVGTHSATQVFKDGDYVEVDANKGIVRKIKDKDQANMNKLKYYFSWGERHSVISTESWLNGYVSLRDIIANDNKNVFIMAKNGCLETYNSEQDLKISYESGRKILDHGFLEIHLKRSKKIREEFDILYKSVKNKNLKRLSDKALLDIFTRYQDIFDKVWAYFKVSQPEYLEPAREKLNSLLDLNFKDADEKFITLTTPIGLDMIKEEQLAAYLLSLKKEISHEDLLRHAEDFPWLFFNTYDRQVIMDFLTKKFNDIKSIDEKQRKIHIADIKDNHQKHILDFNNIINSANREKEEIRYLSDVFGKLALDRLKLKHWWGGAEYLFLSLFDEIASRANIGTEELLMTYKASDIGRLLSGHKYLNLLLRKSRRSEYAVELSDGKLTFYDSETTKNIFNSRISPSEISISGDDDVKGMSANLGKVTGRVYIVSVEDLKQLIKDMENFNEGDVLVTTMTQPTMVSIARKASAIVTDEGGITSHASILAREFKIPCVVGTHNATKKLKTGDMVEVDANKGIVRKVDSTKISNTPDIDEIASIRWTKNWSGKFSMLAISASGESYTFPQLKFKGTKMPKSLYIYHKGITTCYLPCEIKQKCFDNIVRELVKDEKLLVKWADDLHRLTDSMVRLMSRSVKTFFNVKNYNDFFNLYLIYEPTQVLVKIVADYLPPELLQRYGKELENARVHTEHVYDKVEKFYEKISKEISKRENYPVELLMSMSSDELIIYFKERKLPSKDELLNRYKRSALYYDHPNSYILVDKIDELEHKIAEKSGLTEGSVKGISAYTGKVRGRCKILLRQNDFGKFKQGDIIVATMTRPEYVPLMSKASAVVTDAGGLLCHAAIVARELKIPCVVGTEVATKAFKDGDMIEVDADSGVVRKTGQDNLPIIRSILNKYHLKPTTQRNLPLLTASIIALSYTVNFKKRLNYSYKAMAFIGKENYFHSMMDEEGLYHKTRQYLRNADKKQMDNIFKSLLSEFYSAKKNIYSSKQNNDIKKRLDLILDNYLKYMSVLGIYNCFWRYVGNNEHDEYLSDQMIKRISQERDEIAKVYPEIDKIISKLTVELGRKEGFDGSLLIYMSYYEFNNYLKNRIGKDMIEELNNRKKGYFYAFEEGSNKEIILTDSENILKISKEFFDIAADISEVKGFVANKGNAKGIVFNPFESNNIPKEGYILVTPTTHPKDLPLIKKAKALVVDEGGLLSHAAIISRELGKPCIIGTKIGTKVFKNGEMVELDTDKGVVRKLDPGSEQYPKDLFFNLTFYATRPQTVQRDELASAIFAISKGRTVSIPYKDNSRSLYVESERYESLMVDLIKSVDTYPKWKRHLKNYGLIADKFLKIAKRLGTASVKDRKLCINLLKEWWVTYGKYTSFIFMPFAIEKYLEPETKELLHRLYKDKSEEMFSIIGLPSELNDYQLMRLGILDAFKAKDKPSAIRKLVDKYQWYSEYSYVEPLLDYRYFESELKKLTSDSARKEREQIDAIKIVNKKRWDNLKKSIKNSRLKLLAEIIHSYTLIRTQRIDILKKGQFSLRIFFSNLASDISLSSKSRWDTRKVACMTTEEILEYLSSGKLPSDESLDKRDKHEYIYYYHENKPHFIYDKKTINSIVSSILEKEDQNEHISGTIAYKGVVKGIVRVISSRNELSKINEGDILVARSTMTEYTPAMTKAVGFITDEGGVTCHASVIAREQHKPCIVGTGNATRLLKDGDYIELDADNGIVRKIHSNNTCLDLNPKDFKKFFTIFADITCLHGEFLMKGSLGKSDVFLTSRNHQYNTFLRKEKEKICLDEGVELFGDQKKYTDFMNEFRAYIKYAKSKIIPKYSKVPSNLTKEEAIRDIKSIGRFWHFYGYTEFFYIDDAYRIAKQKNNKIMMDNLNEISMFKFEARKVLNSYFFKKGVMENLLTYFSKKYLSKDDARYLYSEELISLFDGNKPSKKLIEERRDCFSAAIIDGNIIRFQYKEAKRLNELFTKLESVGQLKGVTANPGIAEGRAIISPMLNDHKEIQKINKMMLKGDILIAETTSPDTMMLCSKAAAIVADQGGMLSHAAIVSREIGIPCIVQTDNATKIFKTGDYVRVDANTGTVRKINNLKTSKQPLMKKKTSKISKKAGTKKKPAKHKATKKGKLELYTDKDILWFRDLKKEDIPIVGGKGANLGEMYNHFPIPNGFCVTVHGYRKFMEMTGIIEHIHGLLDALDVEETEKLDETSKKIRDMILKQKFPASLKKEIISNYKRLNHKKVAVRSSATAEDLPTASFAGQQDTYLNMTGDKKVIDAVQRCWASLFTSRAIYYREKNNFKHRDVLISVVIQEMIDADFAGVMFTIDPVNKKYILIEVVEGLGESLVSGMVTPNTYFVHKSDSKIMEQSLQFAYDEKVIHEVAKVGRLIEKHYKKPMDVEFAVKKGKLYILQARPITTL